MKDEEGRPLIKTEYDTIETHFIVKDIQEGGKHLFAIIFSTKYHSTLL